MNEPTVSASDIARLAGVGRAAVSNWRRRYEDFPAPVDSSTNPRFALQEVERWLGGQGKLLPDAQWERLWGLVEAHRGDHEPADVLGSIGDLLTGRATPDLHAALLHEVDTLARAHGARETFEGLWERFLRANARWVSATPPELATFMAELTGLQAGVALDPAAGAGSVLAALPGGIRLLAQEIDPGMARISATRLALRGADADVRTGDSLLADAHQGRLVDAVLCDPPFNERHWGHDELIQDPRWQYGIPPRMESELAWVQHAVAHLKPGGIAVLTMPPSAASRRSGRRIRAELVRSSVLRAVISLPPIGSAVPVQLWILRRDARVSGNFLVVNAPTTTVALNAWREFDATGTLAEQPGVARAVPMLELLRGDSDLTPLRNLPVQSAPKTIDQMRAMRRDLAVHLDRLPSLLPAPEWQRAGSDVRVSSTVAELVTSGALTYLQANAPDRDEGTAEVLELQDLLTGGPPAGRAPGEFLDRYVSAGPGDVVVPATGSRLVARVVDKPVVLGRGLCLLRPNPAVLDPWFLAGFLGSTANSRQASSQVSTGTRLDVKRCEVPRLPLPAQRRYAEVFREMGRFAGALAETGKLAHTVLQGMTDGMAESVIAPR